jgi:hypothetical protein
MDNNNISKGVLSRQWSKHYPDCGLCFDFHQTSCLHKQKTSAQWNMKMVKDLYWHIVAASNIVAVKNKKVL